MLPAFKQGLEDVAFVQFGVAHYRDHASRQTVVRGQAMQMHVVLHQGGEQGRADAETDRAGGKVDVVGILGPRRIRLRPAEGPKILQALHILFAEQVLQCMEDRRRMGFYGDPVFGSQHIHVKGRHQGRGGGAGRLMAADLEAVAAWPHVIGVVDHPRGQPQDFAFDFVQTGDVARRKAFGRGLGIAPGGNVHDRVPCIVCPGIR